MLNKTVKSVVILIFFIVGLFSDSFAQNFKPNWESLDKRPVPEWWKQAKFGIFIHWGVYSVPAYAPVDGVEGAYEKYSEHYQNRLIQKNRLFVQHHENYFGKNFTYQDFAPMFKAEYFEPDEWSELIKMSGAKYVVLTSKHHDGFALWPSEQSPNWNSVDQGPHRDIVGELTTSVRKKGLRMGLYYSLLEWNQATYNPVTISKWVDDHMIPQLKDLVIRYKPEIIFADGEWDYTSEELKSANFLSWLYNDSPVRQTVVVNDRWGKETRSKHGDYYTTEYDLIHDKTGIGEKANHPWEESRGIGTSYGYNQFERIDNYSSSKQLIDLLIEKVSNGGNLLLDIGPKADGLIPVIMQERLLDIGKWLKVNGEAIYNTTVWDARPVNVKAGIKFTMNKNNLYIICTAWPSSPLLINGIIKTGKVSLLGYDKKLKFSVNKAGLSITPPTVSPGNLLCDHAWVFKVENFMQ